MSGKKIWAGRFSAQTDPLMEQFGNSLDIDRHLFDADIAVNKEWAQALAEIGVYNQNEADQVALTLDQIQSDFHQGRIHVPEMVEDIHSANEKWLTERLGRLGEKIHTGRSRN
ncbi:MAG: argininosuccinate lyase, partial [Calditrichaeota bacterium]